MDQPLLGETAADKQSLHARTAQRRQRMDQPLLGETAADKQSLCI
jgi:hypothetical protein